MIEDLNRWTVGWIDWNLALNVQGGPNHVGNWCSAPILIDGANDALLHQSSYFYIGHFARVAPAGARRVLCAATLQALECTAFANADGSVATVAMNRSEAPIRFVLRLRAAEGEIRFVAELPARAIGSFVSAG